MADLLDDILRRKKVVFSKLEPYGFERTGENYSFHKKLKGSGFLLTICIDTQGRLSARVLDPAFNEPYTLHLVDGAVGGFVGSIKGEYEETLTEIVAQCFEPDVFKTPQAKSLIAYVRTTYGDELEYLWSKFPDNAIWRRKDNAAWYGAILTVSERKLGFNSDKRAEILDLRYPPDELEKLVDGKRYFPGWHMNKRNWYTIILDESIDTTEIQHRISQSYLLAVK